MANPRSRTTALPAAPSRPRKQPAGRKTCKKAVGPCCAAFVSTTYLPHIRLRKRSWEVDERILRQHILPTFGNCPLESIQRSSVEIWLHALARQGLAPATCNRILSVFKSLCTLAVSHDVLFLSPCASIPPFRILQLRERHLTADEAHRLMQALNSSSPLTRIRPSSGVSRKFRQRSSVVFPLPEEPMMDKTCPFSREKEMPFSTCRPP